MKPIISGNSVTKVADFNGTIPVQRGIFVINDVIYANAGGYIVSIGDRYKTSYAVNQLTYFSNTGYSGVLAYNQLGDCFVGSSAASDGTVPCFNNINGGATSGSARFSDYYPDVPSGKLARLKNVVIEYDTVLTADASNGNMSMVISTDANSGSYTLIANKASVAIPLINRFTRDVSENILGASTASFTSFQILISWNAGSGGSAPRISRISVEYEFIEAKN